MKWRAHACTALLAVGYLLMAMSAAPAQAQQPIVGGTLYTAMPGPVSMQLVADRTGSSLNWFLPLRWRTGPLDLDYESTLQQLGRTNSPAWSNNAPGTTLSSPALPARNVIIIGAHIFSDFNFSDPNPLNLLVHTGDMPVGFLTEQPIRAAVIFRGANQTVGIGFPIDHFSPVSSNFLDYPIRILLSNVCVR
jgi:hypothetical protein